VHAFAQFCISSEYLHDMKWFGDRRHVVAVEISQDNQEDKRLYGMALVPDNASKRKNRMFDSFAAPLDSQCPGGNIPIGPGALPSAQRMSA
jgi:hypothetical protein